MQTAESKDDETATLMYTWGTRSTPSVMLGEENVFDHWFDEDPRKCNVDVSEAILTRRSVRRFLDRPVEPESIERILEAARRAPSDENRQRCRFVVVQNRPLLQLIKRFSPGIISVPGCVIAVCSHRESRPGRFGGYLAAVGCAMAAQNILLTAHALCLGACVVRSFSSVGIRELLRIPEDVEPELLVTLGYPNETPEPVARKPLGEIAFRDRYGQGW